MKQLTVTEAAKTAGISRRTVELWVRRKLIDAERHEIATGQRLLFVTLNARWESAVKGARAWRNGKRSNGR